MFIIKESHKMGFKSFISNGWNKLKNGINQGISGAKSAVSKVWDKTKQGLTSAKNFVVNNRQLIGGALQAVSPFVSAMNPVVGSALAAGGTFLKDIPSGNVKEKLTDEMSKVNEYDSLATKPTNITSGSNNVQASLDARRNKNKRLKGKVANI